MLVSLSPRVTQQILLRSCSVAATTAVGSFQQQLLLQCAPSLSSCSTSSTGSHRRSHSTRASYYGQQQQQQQQQPRRPYVVNGKAVAFHVNDLADPSFAKPSTAANNKTQNRALANHAAAAAVEEDYDYAEDYDATTTTTAIPKRQYDSDLIVVLDMDECLIHSQFLTNNPGAKFYAHQVARNSKDDSSSTDSSSNNKVETFRFHLPDSHDLVQVNQRPHLEAFLEAVTSKYETHIYTAAMKVYAEPILDKLDPTGTRFAQRWYRETCDHDKTMGAYVKNLSNLRFEDRQARSNNGSGGMTYDEYLAQDTADDLQASHPLRRVVLVDNNPLSFLSHPTNGILVSSFYNDATDKTLPAVLDLLEELEDLEDVRPTLDSRFGLKAALSEIQGNRRQQQQQKWVASS